MFNSHNAIQCMGLLMSKTSIDLNTILELVELLNASYFECQRVVTILTEVFEKQKSARILHAVHILQYLVKNGNKNFHQAANKASFQKCILHLLRRVRGKSSLLKDLRSNTDNWNKIEAKVLFLVQLWYDAFMLDEAVYNNIVSNYKTLRKENVVFPPRLPNEKNLISVQTESPIMQNIQDIARQDHQKFSKTLSSMGMKRQQVQFDMVEHEIERVAEKAPSKPLTRKIDLDEISERIAIVRSNGCQGREMLKLIEEIKRDLEHGSVDKSQQKYWKDIKEAAESVIQEWEDTNAQLIRQYQRQYLQSKLGKMAVRQPQKQQEQQLDFFQAGKEQAEKVEVPVQSKAQEIDLLDL